MLQEVSSIDVAFIFTDTEDKFYRFLINELANSFLYKERKGKVMLIDNQIS
jgi:hypothetical protein